MAILFLKGTSASFKDPTFTPVADVFYMLTDTGDFYLGSRKLTSDQDLADAVQNIAANAADIAAIQATLAKLENDESTAGSIRNIIRGYIDGEIQQKLDKKVDKEIVGTNGKALVFNEADSGGAKFEHNDGTWSFVGVNDGGENGLTGQLYSIDHSNENLGTRINMTNGGFFYTRNKKNASYDAEDEIATKRDVASASGNADSKTVYMKDETVSGGDFAKTYVFYQGSDASDMTKNTKIGQIDLAKDKFLQRTAIVTVDDGVDSEGDETDVTDGVYIKMVMQNQEEALYLNVLSLVEDFTVQENAAQIQLAISPERELSATIVAGSVGSTELADGAVTAAKLAAGAKALFDEAGAANAVKADVIGSSEDAAGDISIYGALKAAENAILTWGSFGE